VVGRLVQGNGDAEETLGEGSVGKEKNGLKMISGADPYAESILLLQRTQEALENGMDDFSPSLSSFTDQFLKSLFVHTNVAWCSSYYCIRKKLDHCYIFPEA
jgi:hypothetical protein